MNQYHQRTGLPLDGCRAGNSIKGKHERDSYGKCQLCGDGLASPAPASAQEGQGLTDEQIDNELESAREYIVEGFGYKYNEHDLAAAIRRLSRQPATTMGSVVESNEIHTLRRLIECAEVLDKRPRPMCRDCADEDGTCPNSGLDCDMRKLFAGAKALHNKLALASTATPQPPADSARFGESVGEDEPLGWVQFIDGVQTQNFARDERELAITKKLSASVEANAKIEYVPVYAHMMSKLGGEAGSIDTPEFRELLSTWYRAKSGSSRSSKVSRNLADLIAHIDAFVLAKLAQTRAAGGSVEGKPSDWIESKGRRSNRGGRYWHVKEKDDPTDDCIVDSFFTEDEAKQFCAAHPDHEYFNWID